MALYMIDAYEGRPHITAPQVGDYNMAVSGAESCVYGVGEKMRAEAVSSNTVRIYDGCYLMQGRRGGIPAGAYEDVTIENGTQSKFRNDIIALKYTMESSTRKESVSLVVFKGTPGAEGADPEVTEGDIRAGDTEVYMLLYRVRLNGVNVAGLDRLFEIRKTMKEMSEELNRRMTDSPTNSTVAVFNSTGKLISSSTVSTTELGYLDGCTSKVQTQIDTQKNRFKAGTVTKTISSGQTSVAFLTVANVNTALNRTDITTGNALQKVFVAVMNAEGNAADIHFDGCTQKSGVWYCTFNNAPSGSISIRINYLIVAI